MHGLILDLQSLFLFHWRTRYITSIYSHMFLSARCNNSPALTQSTVPQMPIVSFHVPVIAKFNLIVNYARHNECPALYKMSWRGTTHVRLYLISYVHTFLLSQHPNGTAQRMSGSNHLIGNIAWHGTTSVRPISFSFIHQISCQLIAFLCKNRRPAYPLMRQGPASCALRFVIKDQCPVPFLSHSYIKPAL